MDPVLKQKAAAIASLANDIKPLAEKSKASELSDDESTRFDDLTGQLNSAMADFKDTEERLAKANDALDVFTKFSEPTGHAPARDLNQPQQRDTRSVGQRFIDSDEFKTFAARPQGTGDKFQAPDFLTGPDGQKTLVYSGTPTASFLPAQVLPGIDRGREPMSAVRQVLRSGRTNAQAVTIQQESLFTNAAAEVAESNAVDDAAGVKPESALDWTEVTFNVRTIAHWIPVTRTILEDWPFLQSYIDGRLRDGLERRIDNQLINGDGTAPNISGILDQSGLTVADATYFAGTPVKDAGTDNENINRIRRAKRLVSTTGLATPTFILANPADTEKWDTVTTTDGDYLIGDPTSGAGVPRLWGLPVYEDEYITAGTALVGDGTQAVVVDRNDAAVYMADQHSDFFIRNIFVMLAEVRLTLVVFKPAAFVSVTLAA